MKLLYSPIDIDISKIDVSKITSSVLKEGKYQPYWKTKDITTIDLAEIQYIIEQLPFDRITNIYFKEQTAFAKPHYDVYPDMEFADGEYQHILDHEPAGYRIVLIGNNDRLYVRCNNKFKQAVMPTIPGCYVLNSTQGLHMVKNDVGRKIIYFRGFVDPIKHRMLIDKSLTIYKDLAIIE